MVGIIPYMPQIKRQKIVRYSPKAMFDLVNDVAHYAEFVPWCTESRVLSETRDELRAALTFAKSGLSKSFSTINRLEHSKMIEMRLLDGPFKHLEGFWRFEPYGEAGCKISFDLEFEFSTKMLGFMFGPLFNQVTNKLVDVFCERAEKLYETN